MKTFLKNIASGFIMCLIFVVSGVVYASLSLVEPGETLTSNKWNEIVSEVNTMPGMIVAFNLTSCPSGWIPANGQNGTPDLRGVFIRGANSFDNGITYNNRDVDRANAGSGALTYQDDQMRAITGTIHNISTLANWKNGALFSSGPAGRSPSALNTAYGTYINLDSALLGENYDGKDTHPKNVALIYCVKE